METHRWVAMLRRGVSPRTMLIRKGAAAAKNCLFLIIGSGGSIK